jgi:RNA polymerase sigma-70 factor (ECF subfamily)
MTMDPSTPVSLLERLRRPDDADAWGRFVHLYTPLLYRWALRTGLQAADAADLVQDTFAILIRELPQFRYDPGRSFHRWLYTVLRNGWRDGRKRRPVPQPVGDDPALAAAAAPDELDAWIDDEFRADLVRRALQVMQADFQPATWRACWEVVVHGRSAADVAAELGLTVGAVYAARFRVLGRLRQELAGLID